MDLRCVTILSLVVAHECAVSAFSFASWLLCFAFAHVFLLPCRPHDSFGALGFHGPIIGFTASCTVEDEKQMESAGMNVRVCLSAPSFLHFSTFFIS